MRVLPDIFAVILVNKSLQVNFTAVITFIKQKMYNFGAVHKRRPYEIAKN